MKVLSDEEIKKRFQEILESDEAIKILNDEKELDRRVKKLLDVLQPISEEKD